MNHARIHGDPFANGPDASQLRSFLRYAAGNGLQCSLSLSGVPVREGSVGERQVPLTDGSRNWTVSTDLPPAEVDMILRAANTDVCSTAPLVVFAPEAELPDVAKLAGLEWPQAATVISARAGVQAGDLLSRLRGELRWAGNENPLHALNERQLKPWLELADADEANADGPLVHVANDSFECGTDLVIDAFLAHHASSERKLRLVLPNATAAEITEYQQRLAAVAARVEIRQHIFCVDDVRDAAAIVLPMRRCLISRTLVFALASGRPVCAARFAQTAEVLHGRGVVHAIGGRNISDDAYHGEHFAPQPAAIAEAIDAALQEGAPSPTAQRARRHVVGELVQGRPACPPPAVVALGESRPTVVLEAPIFETSSTAELTIATAEALQSRGNVDLRIVPSAPFRHDLSWLRARAPALETHLCRNPGRVDLWLSAGWPVRASRPECRAWATRIDWEYGALPSELTPHATQDADVAVVHSEFVYRSMTAAGRPMTSVNVVPHGVDPVMNENARPADRILEFKGNRPAVLFCGGLVWRKGFDVFMQAVLSARAAGEEFVVVVKSTGTDQHYGKANLHGLLERFRNTPGTPPLMLIDADLSREQLASVYTACDVMLHPYRGEGFCMPVLEARACGLPVIATAGGATDQLMDGPGAHKINSERRPVELSGAHVSAPWVLEPQGEHASEQLLEVLRDLSAQQHAARSLAPAVRSAFTWDAAAQAIEQLADLGLRRRSVVEAGNEPVVMLAPQPPRVISQPVEPVGT